MTISFNARRRAVLGALAASAVMPFAKGLRAAAPTPVMSEALRDALSASWKARYGGRSGGLTMMVQAPDAAFFASTLDGVTPDTFFRGASITKTFTAASIMLLDQRGQLRIDDAITAAMPGRPDPYLPEGPGFAIPNKEQITIRQLLGHRAGVFDLANTAIPATLALPYAGEVYTDWAVARDPHHTFDTDELIGVLAATQLSHSPPGQGFHYSDTHYTLLEKIVQRVSGQPLDEFKASEFVKPNGLAATHFVVDGHDTDLPEPAIAGFILDSDGVKPMQNYNYSYDPGSGNLVTTSADLVRWIRRLIRGEAGVSPAQIARMTEMSADTPYGLGILRKSAGDTVLGYGHNGGTAGYLTDALHNPATDVSYVLQCSLIDFTAIGDQINWLSTVGKDALQRLGLPERRGVATSHAPSARSRTPAIRTTPLPIPTFAGIPAVC